MKKLGVVNALYPMPTTLVGATVSGRPNFITIAHVGIMNHGKPQFISLGISKTHYTNKGIIDNKNFSVCIPSEDLVVKTDYCGIMTGKKTDKAALFKVFYGELETAPMIEECPICMECRLHDIFDFETHDIFIGEIVETYAADRVLSDGKIDVTAVKPLLFDMNSIKYYSLGEPLEKCWSVGKNLKNEN
jgi:flavin reductase (DIM6/NTAB) family NADH-FMN oxidoreductase RutF